MLRCTDIMAAEALRAALRLLPRLPLHEAGAVSNRARQPRFLEQLLHGPGSHSKGRGVSALGSGSRGAKAGVGWARLARTMLAYFGAGTFVLVGVGGQTVHASCRDNASKGSPSSIRAAAADVRNRWHRHRSQVCQEDMSSSLRSSATSSPPPLSPLFSPAWFPPASKPQDAPPQAVLSRIHSWEVLEVAPTSTAFPSLQWDLSPAGMDSRPRSWIEPAITGQSPSGLGLLMQRGDVPNLELEPPLDDADEMADVKAVAEVQRKVEHSDITGNIVARAPSSISSEQMSPALRVEVASTLEGPPLHARGDVVENPGAVRGGLSARLSGTMGEEECERGTGEMAAIAAVDEGPDGHWSMHAQWKSSRRDESEFKYRPFKESSSLRESVLLFGEALCHSQTRAREAEEAVKATAAENKHLKRMLEYEAGRAYTYQLWAATVALENGFLRRTSETTASALGKPSSACEFADPFLHRMVKKNMRSEAGEQESLSQRPCKRRRKGKVKQWSDQVVFSCTMIVATGAIIAGAAIFVGWKLGWIVWTKKCWFLL